MAGTEFWDSRNGIGTSVELTISACRQLSSVKSGWFLLVYAASGVGFTACITEIDDVLWDNFCSLT